MKFRFPAICALLLCLAVNAAGQGGTRDFSFVYDTNPYLNLNNPAGISFWDGKIATAAVSFEKHNGGLKDIEESSDSWEAIAGTESYFRVSELLSFHGKLIWSDFSGKDMGGPIMMKPDYNPVGFFELNETTLGRKQRELYTLGGEIALNLGDRWGLGIGVNYQAGDQTKVKDPRFSNIWMDLDVNAGVTFTICDWLTLGTNARWRNTLENVKGHIYGTTDKQYFICTDKGAFLGTVAELNGDYNYIPDSTPRPMNNDYFGGALQAVLFGGKFSNEFTLLSRTGYYGKKSSTTATFFEFGGLQMGYKGIVLLPVGRYIFRAELSAGIETLKNNENQFHYSTPEGGNTIVEYTGQNHVGDRQKQSASLDLRWYGGVEGDRASFTAGVRGGWDSMQQTTTLYPFWRNQVIRHINVGLFCQKNFYAGNNIFTLDASGDFLAGSGTKKDDGSYVPDATSVTLRSFDDYLDKHYEAQTAPRAGGSIGVTYTRPVKSLSPWIKLSDNFTTLLANPDFLEGKTRNILTVSIGCTF
ncbi:MAG: hypothetical protein IKN31_02575 [Bacteroidales bacterium]|nr:hypothetical protein [Bacteroidales bacterium]